MIARLAVVAALVVPGAVRAEPGAGAAAAPAPSGPPDQAAVEAGDANLEPTGNHRGLTFALAVGGGLIVGVGIEDSVGRGGAVSLRLGHGATPNTVITFESSVTAALHRPTGGSIETNTNTNLLAGAQYYVGESLWLRAAGGVGIYQGRQVVLANQMLGNQTLVGPSALVSLGIDLVRFKSVVLGFEIATSASVNGDGVLFASSSSFALAFD